MAFSGALEAPELTPAPCGLLSVARVVDENTSQYDEKWVRGFANQFNSEPTVRLLTVVDDVVTNGTLFDQAGRPTYQNYVPFFIEVENKFSGLDALIEDQFALPKMQARAVAQKALEVELWDGRTAIANSNSNIFLSKASTATVVASGTSAPFYALYLLEQAIANSPTGENGVIHMTRDVASVLGESIETHMIDGELKMFTRIGTPVVMGSGYSGNGRVGDGNAAASATNKWMYATSMVDVRLGEIQVVNEDFAHGINPATNEIIIKTVQPAAAYFDPSIHYAARVALPTS
jgi:hypothetical protein